MDEQLRRACIAYNSVLLHQPEDCRDQTAAMRAAISPLLSRLSAAEAEIERLRASLAEAVKLLSEGAADLGAEIEARRSGELPRRIERDLEIVHAMRDFITKHSGGKP